MAEPAMQFPGVDALIDAVDIAVRQSRETDIVCSLRRTLCHLIRESSIQLPDCVYRHKTDGYARRELYTSEDLGYSIIAMTWGPGQGTPIHDHCGMWCVEGVWAGELEVVQYEPRNRDNGMVQFEAVGSIQAGTGSAGSLIPPHEYHTISNLSATEAAVSIHVYSGTMKNCNVFVPDDNRQGWYRRCERQLTLDN